MPALPRAQWLQFLGHKIGAFIQNVLPGSVDLSEINVTYYPGCYGNQHVRSAQNKIKPWETSLMLQPPSQSLFFSVQTCVCVRVCLSVCLKECLVSKPRCPFFTERMCLSTLLRVGTPQLYYCWGFVPEAAQSVGPHGELKSFLSTWEWRLQRRGSYVRKNNPPSILRTKPHSTEKKRKKKLWLVFC